MSKGLGKGLSALIADKKMVSPSGANDELTDDKSSREILPTNSLRPGKFQPRTVFNEDELTELADSIRQNGIVQPILVRAAEEESNHFDIIAGERRWRAAKIAGQSRVPVIVMDINDKRAYEIALVENIQRADLNVLEEAEGYSRLIKEFSYTQDQLAEIIGKSRPAITNAMRLLGLPDGVKEMLNDRKLTPGHARALLQAKDPEEMAQQVIKKDMSVRQTEAFVRKGPPRKQEVRGKSSRDPEIVALERELSKKLGLHLTITNAGDVGKVSISYYSLLELDQILQRLEYGSEKLAEQGGSHVPVSASSQKEDA